MVVTNVDINHSIISICVSHPEMRYLNGTVFPASAISILICKDNAWSSWYVPGLPDFPFQELWCKSLKIHQYLEGYDVSCLVKPHECWQNGLFKLNLLPCSVAGKMHSHYQKPRDCRGLCHRLQCQFIFANHFGSVSVRISKLW